MFSRTMNKNLMTVLGLAFLIHAFVVLGYYLSVAPIGTHFLLSFTSLAIFPLLAVVLVFPISLILLCWRRYRIQALTTLLGCLIYFVVGLAGISLANNVRHSGFVNLAQRSRPLVGAINNFEAKYNQPPPSLEQLVPEFLPVVPGTGIGAYPNYMYSVVNDQKSYEGNGWVLKVETPSGALNWDTFLYFPKQNYPQVGYGGVLERIEDWAYVHE